MQGLAIASIILAVASSEIPVPGTWHDTLAAKKFEKGSDSLVVSAVGDSITYGSCSSDPSSRAYPPQMADMVNNASRTIYNFGVSGATMMKTGDLPYWEQDAYAMALQSSPDIVVIMLGTNDASLFGCAAGKATEDVCRNACHSEPSHLCRCSEACGTGHEVASCHAPTRAVRAQDSQEPL